MRPVFEFQPVKLREQCAAPCHQRVLAGQSDGGDHHVIGLGRGNLFCAQGSSRLSTKRERIGLAEERGTVNVAEPVYERVIGAGAQQREQRVLASAAGIRRFELVQVAARHERCHAKALTVDDCSRATSLCGQRGGGSARRHLIELNTEILHD